jgi:hypothetical protein
MYKRLCAETISDTSQHWHLAGHTDSRMYIKIISAKPRYIHILIPLPHDTSQAQGKICATLIDKLINHHVHSTTYVEDFDNISVANSKKKILLGANMCNNENKFDVTSCVLIGSILLKIKQPKDHVMVPQGFPKVRDTFLSSSTRPKSTQ